MSDSQDSCSGNGSGDYPDKLPPKRVRRKPGLPVTPVPRSSKPPGELLTAEEKKVRITAVDFK